MATLMSFMHQTAIDLRLHTPLFSERTPKFSGWPRIGSVARTSIELLSQDGRRDATRRILLSALRTHAVGCIALPVSHSPSPISHYPSLTHSRLPSPSQRQARPGVGLGCFHCKQSYPQIISSNSNKVNAPVLHTLDESY